MAVLSDKQFLWLAGGAVVAVVAVGWFARRRVAEAAKHINPADPQNIINRTHEAWWQAITGQESGGIGVWLADLIHPPMSEAEIRGPVLPAPRYD